MTQSDLKLAVKIRFKINKWEQIAFTPCQVVNWNAKRNLTAFERRHQTWDQLQYMSVCVIIYNYNYLVKIQL